MHTYITSFSFQSCKDLILTSLVAARKGYDEILGCILDKSDAILLNILTEAFTEGLANVFEVSKFYANIVRAKAS